MPRAAPRSCKSASRALPASDAPPRTAIAMNSRGRPQVRAMQAADAAIVVAMAQELAAHVGDPPPALREADLVRDTSGPQRWGECFVVEIDGEIIGYAIACRAFEAHTGRTRLLLGDLYVRPAVRGSGAGRALMTAIARQALALGCDALTWELWRMISAGAAFYRKLKAEDVADRAVMRLGEEKLRAIVAEG